MNVLSLFDGMSCGRVALERAGIEVTNYYASEIDKYAIQISKKNWPDAVHLGSVENWRDWDIDWGSIDLIIAGSPCQGFSFAGNQLAFDDPRSALFFTFVDIVCHIEDQGNDVKFLLENVKMNKEHLAVINEYLAVEPEFINSALVSAQNRQRYYWANFEITQPEDRGILLSDVLETQASNVTLMSPTFIKRQKGRNCLVDSPKDKASSLSAMEYVKNGRQGDYIKCDPEGEQVIYPASIVGRRINEAGVRDDYNMDVPIRQCLEVNAKNKSRCLSTVQKDSLLSVLPEGRYIENYNEYYRKLTPVECERLQTLPDNYTEGVSNTQRYKMLGNGWTVDVIAHIFGGLK